MGQFHVLRIGHRPERDKRITTHVALTARAFGASKIYFSRPDSRVVTTIENVVEKFGGDFSVETISNPKKIAKDWKGKVVHLTVFGLPLKDFVKELKSETAPILFVVGAEKVPPWAFEYADYNLSIGNQPHSEVSALAISLSIINDKFEDQEFGGPLKVIPSTDHRNMIDTEH